MASAGLVWCAMEGCSGPANPLAARQWLQPLRAAQPGRALYLEWLLTHKLSPVDVAPPLRTRQMAEADALLKRALALSDVQAHAAQGRELYAQHRFAEALKAFTLAAPHSPAAARNVELVKARMALESTPPSTKPSTRPVPDPEAAYLQARRLHRGEGVPANYTEAIRLYLLADRLGHAQARKMLSLIYSRPLVSGDVDIGWMRQLADLDLTLPSPRVLQPSQGLVLHEDATPLLDLLPPAWRG
jgi:TPR repeat protein